MHDLRDAIAFHQVLLRAQDAPELTCNLYRGYEVAFVEFLRYSGAEPTLAELNPRRVMQAMVAAFSTFEHLGRVLEEYHLIAHSPLKNQELKWQDDSGRLVTAVPEIECPSDYHEVYARLSRPNPN